MIELLTGLSRLIRDDPEQRNLGTAVKSLHYLAISAPLGLWGTYWADSLLEFLPRTLISANSNGAAGDILGILAPIHLGGYLMAINMKTLLKPLINATMADGIARGRALEQAEGQALERAKTEARYENYLERLRQAGVQIPEDIPLDPPEDGKPPSE